MKFNKVGLSLVSTVLLSSLSAYAAGETTPAAPAAEEATAKDSVTLKDVKFTTDFRAVYTYDDQGIRKTGGFTPDKTQTIGLDRMKFGFSGALDRDVDFKLVLNTLNFNVEGKSPLENAYVSWKAMDMLSILMGQDKVAQGGVYERIDQNSRFYAPMKTNGYVAEKTDKYQKMVAATLSPSKEHKVTVQLFDDQNVEDKANQDYSKDGAGQHPTFAVQYHGDMGVVKPLVQIGTYDNNKSKWISLGTEYKVGDLNGYFNYQQTTDTNYYVENDKRKEAADVASSIELEVGYNVSEKIKPYMFLNIGEVKQGKGLTGKGEDSKVNGEKFNDNIMRLALGVNMKETKALTTFAGLQYDSGKFADAKKSAEKGKTVEETRSNMAIKLGMMAKI